MPSLQDILPMQVSQEVQGDPEQEGLGVPDVGQGVGRSADVGLLDYVRGRIRTDAAAQTPSQPWCVLTVKTAQTVLSLRAQLLCVCHHASPTSSKEVRNPGETAHTTARASAHVFAGVGNRHPRLARGRR